MKARIKFLTLVSLMLLPICVTLADWQRDAVCQGSCGGGCGPCPSTSPSPSYTAPSRDYEAERRAQEEAEAARRAEAERQAELERQRREAENKRLVEEAARQAKFLEERDATARSLRGSTGAQPISSGSGAPVLRGSSSDTGLRGLKSGTSQTTNLDPMVVDTRNVPSGLPKGVDNAIATAYSSAPPGVSDRVRKGFQAVMVQDWKVAKAWFQDALKLDPSNANLKRLVVFTDSSQQSNRQTFPVDERNEPAGLGGRSKLLDKVSAPSNKKKTGTAGDRALSEQMFEQGLQFLIMGDEEHAKQMFQQADFQRNFDAGEPSSSSVTTNKASGNPGKKK